MARDHLAYFEELAARGYGIEWNMPHIRVFWEGLQVTSGSSTGWQARGLANLQACVRRFEREHGLAHASDRGRTKGKARKRGRKVTR